jgi:hypothetical protein
MPHRFSGAWDGGRRCVWRSMMGAAATSAATRAATAGAEEGTERERRGEEAGMMAGAKCRKLRSGELRFGVRLRKGGGTILLLSTTYLLGCRSLQSVAPPLAKGASLPPTASSTAFTPSATMRR